jgi:hypothetical protein
MPTAVELTNASFCFKMNNRMIEKGFEGLSREDWLRRPNGTSNHMLWIMGHATWARGNALRFLGSTWSRPWLPLFARGAKLVESAEYPTPEEIVLAWKDAAEHLKTALEEVSEETLAAASPEGIPSADGKISGLMDFFAYHDTYHIGQVAYLRCLLGHSAIAG